MRLDWAIPCTRVEVDPHGRPFLIENFGWDRIDVAELPIEIEVLVLIRVVGLREDFMPSADRTIGVMLSGPGLEELLSLEFEARSGEPRADHPEGWEVNTMLPVLIQFTAQDEGTHSIDFSVNRRLQACPIPFRVVRAPDTH